MDHSRAAELPECLHGAILKIVTLYTEPGQRVLLVAAPTGHEQPGAVPPACCAAQSGSGLLAGLIDTAQTAAGLGRTVHAGTADFVCGPRHPGSHTPTPPQSGNGPDTDPTGSGADRVPTAVGTDRFHAVITVVHPRQADWVADTAWARLLTPHGTLAIITHSDHFQGRLIDPGRLLARTARRAGLAELDRVALLEVPIRRSALAAPPPPQADPAGPGPASGQTGVRHTRIHADLYLYTRRNPADTTPPEES